MNSLEEQVKAVLTMNKAILETSIKVFESKEPSKPDTTTDINQQSIQPAFKVQEEVSRMSRQLSMVALI